jgi:hypothetical protein
MTFDNEMPKDMVCLFIRDKECCSDDVSKITDLVMVVKSALYVILTTLIEPIYPALSGLIPNHSATLDLLLYMSVIEQNAPYRLCCLCICPTVRPNIWSGVKKVCQAP